MRPLSHKGRRVGLVAVALLSMAASACGSSGGGTTATTSPSTTSTTAAPTTTSTPASAGGIVFFLTSHAGDPVGPYLTAVWRSNVSTLADSVTALLAGPDRTGEFASPAITTAIPAGTRLLSATQAGDTATVDLTSRFAAGGGSTSMFARLGQLTYTVTAQPGITKVALKLDGHPVTTFSSEGIVLDGPIGRDFVFDAGIVPPVLVEHPATGEPSPALVPLSGYAHRLLGNRFYWSLTRGGEDKVTSGTVEVPNAEGNFSTTITVPAGQIGRFDLVVEEKNGAGQTVFLRQIPFTVS